MKNFSFFFIHRPRFATVSPALGVLLLQQKSAKQDILTRSLNFCLGWFFRIFNRAFDSVNRGYTSIVKRTLRLGFVMLILYGGLLAIAGLGFKMVPGGFIPPQD
ncbi:MAG: efflux RND transporter permease subunit [Verrucomicrobia bacterium]|nr:efflux RND transporter permease subunit [Verrucomicrobiota bacterium]